MNLKKIAEQFGTALDKDDFVSASALLSKNCRYNIGSEILIGPINICNSYEQNMMEGKNKMDQLEWGISQIEIINENEFYVHFTDYLTHQGKKYTHQCKQKLTINSDGLITHIDHVDDPIESKRLKDFYIQVGIIKN